MLRIKFWLILLSITLILLDKFSFISTTRDSFAIYMHKKIITIEYQIKSYPKWIFLQKSTQRQLETENANLKKQIEQDALVIKQQSNLGNEINEVDKLNSKQQQYNHYKVILARGIIDINYLINNKLLIDKGTNQGVEIGDTVVNKDGVIGQIAAVNANNSQIILITNPDYKIYVQNSITKAKMLIQGAGNNNLTIKYMNKNDKIAVGNILVTTGLDDLYPGNIPVAKVSEIFIENNGFNAALCQPVVDFDKLHY
ncbi:MAG: rod shape-determining protein MreC, partial [Burkholderiales bacterium]|nr:rod shape-determining protein MreC [Burkholderiales bacterium]